MSTWSKILSFFIFLSGFTVFLGWLFDVDALKQILPNSVTMKFSTALSLMAIVLQLIFRVHDSPKWFLVGLFAALSLTILPSLSPHVGPYKEFDSLVDTVSPGTPSLMTVLCIIVIASCGIVEATEQKKMHLFSICCSVFLVIVGAISFLGHMFSVRLFYYYISGYSTGMAVHTGVAIASAGLCLLLDDFRN